MGIYYPSSFESSQEEGLLEECLEVLNEYKRIQELLNVDSNERLELLEHKMATVTLYKDLFRVQLDKLLQTLLSQEISKLPEGQDKDILMNVTLDNISTFLENDMYLDGRSISNQIKNIIINLMKNVNTVISNWEFLAENNSTEFKDLNVAGIKDSIEFMLTDNISTFLGENIKLANSFLDENIKQGNFSTDEIIRLQKLINENGFRKIEFGYELDFEKIKYLIYSAIRCKNQILNEREDIELCNLVTVLISYFSNNPGTIKVLEDVREVYKSRPEVIKHIDSLTQFKSKSKLIEISPPIYTNVQKNLMFRIYEQVDGGVRVRIFSLPYSQLEAEETLRHFESIGDRIESYPTGGSSAPENKILSNLVTSDEDIETILSLNPTIDRIGLETINNNDSVLNPIIEDLINKFGPLVKQIIKRLPQIITDEVLRAQYVKMYEDTIRAIDLHFKDKNNIESSLDDEEIETMQAEILDKVMSGQSLESAVRDIVGDKDFNLSTKSEGDCVQFETAVSKKDGDSKTESYTAYKDGTVLSSKEVSGNGFTSRVTEKIVKGEKINTVVCLVCQKEFDTCNEKCPECETDREMQYNAIYNGKTREGKQAIKEISSRIEQRQREVSSDLNRPAIRNTKKPIDPWLGRTVEGIFSGFVSAITLGTYEEPNYYES